MNYSLASQATRESHDVAKARCFLAGLSPSIACTCAVLFAFSFRRSESGGKMALQNASYEFAELFCIDGSILTQQVEFIQQTCALRLP